MNSPQRNTRRIAKSLLEDRFFADLEQMIVNRLHSEADTKEGHAELVRGTGIEDPHLIAELVDLGITVEGLMALRLLPLVLVAWAENGVDEQERSRVMAEANELGIKEDSVAAILLHQWLQKLPHGESVDAWKRLMQSVFKEMSPVAQHKLIDATEHQMIAVAKASGGHLGIGTVSTRERQMIDGLVLALRKQTKSTES